MSNQNDDTTVDETVDTDGETGDSDTTDETTEDTADEDNSTEESDDEGGESTDEEGDEEDEADEGEDDDAEPPSRKPRTKEDFVKMRQSKKNQRQGDSEKEQGEADEDDGDDDVSDADEEVVERIVDKKLAPVFEREQQAEVKAEIDEFVAANPDFKHIATKALKWSKHPTWKNVPTEQLMYAAAGNKLLRMGAKRGKAADEKARKTSTGKGSTSKTGSTKPVEEMSDEEFAAHVEGVKTGQGA